MLNKILKLALFVAISFDVNSQEVLCDSSWTYCDYDFDKAERMIENDTICFPSYYYEYIAKFKNYKTLKELLIRDNYCVDCFQTNYEVIYDCVGCFDQVFIDKMMEKYGKDFLDSAEIYVDSLVSLGLGYEEAYYNGNLESLLRNNLKYYQQIVSDFKNGDESIFRGVIFFVKENGEIVFDDYIAGYMGNAIDEDSYIENSLIKREIMNFVKSMPKWQPAMLRGEPVESEYYLVFDGKY